MSAYIIQTDRLAYAYGERQVLQNISLQVPAGSIFGFLGPNGSGKTTTIRLLLGLIQTGKQRITLFGQDINGNRLSILRRVGALIEIPTLYPHLTGQQNLEIARLARNADRDQVGKVLRMVGLTDDASLKVNGYSLGMRQRLGIALALLGDPDLLILDEPTNGLDPAGIREIRSLLIELSQEHGKTIFVSSHLLSEMEKMVTDVAIIHNGHLLFQGPIGGLYQAYQSRIGAVPNLHGHSAVTLEDIFLNLTNASI
ncbi:ABC transporter ATP-binding protein [Dyadobacter endophyticus]|uniref:ABC transporter ATP-binding protein n=1 Tax=Dyadobacter endophyticus TaxID=1749036 RepID=UPI003CF1BA37